LKNDSITAYGCFHPDYNEVVRYFKENKVYGVQIESVLACDQGCLYCYALNEGAPVNKLPKKSVISILDSAAKMEVRAIDWLGGDPLLRRDWYELMKYAMDKGLKNNIWTSGIPLKNVEMAKKAVKVSEGGFISVHLDSLNEKVYEKLHTGDPKTKIKAILKGVENVQSLGKKPENMFNCITFTRLVAGDDVKNTIRYFFEKWGIRTCLTQMCMAGLAESHPEWRTTTQEIRDACQTRDDINYPDTKISISTMDTNKFYCGGTICVMVNGGVTPCSVIREEFGNIYESSLEEIVKEHRDELLLTHLRNPRNIRGYCGTCENQSVCWGCRATAYYECGDILAEDPKCYINSKIE